ncbi:hypothetical protein MCERE19_00848 [Spirosomataceae bacterium]
MSNRVKIPINLDIDSLLVGTDGREDYKRNLKSGIIYFVSLLCIDNYYKYKSSDGYRTLNGEYLDNVIGRGKKTPRRSVVIKRLLEENGVIEIRGHQSGVKSQGFRLTEKYTTGEFSRMKLDDDIIERIKLYSKGVINNEDEIENTKTYNQLIEQFNNHELKIDILRFNTFLKKIGKEVFEKIDNTRKNKVYNYKSYFNYFGYTLSIIKDIDDKDYFFSIPESNRRFYSNLTSFPKLYRPFLLIDGNGVGEVDIMTSQSYILSTILNERFYKRIGSGYNLTTIHPNLKIGIDNLGRNNPSNQIGRDIFITGVFFSSMMLEGIRNYTNIDFTSDYYTFILEEGKRLYPNHINKHKVFLKGRDYIKGQIMNFLFEWNGYNREGNPFGELMELLYPELCDYVIRFNQYYTSTEFSYLLQRSEVFLMLNVCKELQLKHPNIPFYTIHDSILTTQSNLPIVQKVMTDVITKLTGKSVGVKSKLLHQPTSIDEELIEEIFNKVRIKNEKEWSDNRTYILTKNIKLGIDFFYKGNERKDWYDRLGIN